MTFASCLFSPHWNMKEGRGNTFPHCHPLINSRGQLLARLHLQRVWCAAGRADSQKKNDGKGSNAALLPRRNPQNNSTDFEIKARCHGIAHVAGHDVIIKQSISLQ